MFEIYIWLSKVFVKVDEKFKIHDMYISLSFMGHLLNLVKPDPLPRNVRNYYTLSRFWLGHSCVRGLISCQGRGADITLGGWYHVRGADITSGVLISFRGCWYPGSDSDTVMSGVLISYYIYIFFLLISMSPSVIVSVNAFIWVFNNMCFVCREYVVWLVDVLHHTWIQLHMS